MFDHKHYVPILKGKEAEYGSLPVLSRSTLAVITPMIEIPPVPWDYQSDSPARSLQDHLSGIYERLVNAWGSDRPFFLDLVWLADAGTLPDGQHPLSYVLDRCRIPEVLPIPVTGLGRSHDYQAAVAEAVQHDRRGVCVRLENEDFKSLPRLNIDLHLLLDRLGVDVGETDLVLDFKEVLPHQAAMLQLAVMGLISSLLSISDFRTLTLAGSGFPEDLRAINANSIATVPRSEWAVWEALAQTASALKRVPAFGDYTISSPGLPEIDPRVMRMSANLRYTSERDWVVLKGRDVRTHSYDQFRALCQDMMSRPEYKGPSYSWGDKYIGDCGGLGQGPGNATTWRKVGITHHITLVAEQISTFPWP